MAGPSIRPLGGSTTAVESYKATAKAREVVVNMTNWRLGVMDGAGEVHYTADASTPVTGDNIVLVNAGVNGTVGAPVVITFSATAAAAALISGDSGNGLGLGSDNLLKMASAEGLVAENDELLHVNDDGKIATGLELDYNTATGEFSITNHAGTKIGSVTVPTSMSVLEDVDIVTNPAGQPEGTYFEFKWATADGTGKTLYVDASQFFDVYTGDQSILVEGKVISVRVKANGGVVSTTEGLAVDFTTGVSADVPNILATGTDHKLLVKPYVNGDGVSIDADTQTVSAAIAESDSILEIADGKLKVAPYTSGNGITVDAATKQVSVKLATAENQMATIVDGAVMVSSDFGEME